MRDATFVEAGGAFTCITGRNSGMIDDGLVRCWGNNTRNQLGNPSYPAGTNSELAVGSFTPDAMCGIFFGSWTSPHAGALLDSGNKHVCMFLESMTCPQGSYSRGVHCFGDNNLGQLGIGSVSAGSTVITKVHGLPGNIRSLSSGGDHSCAVDGQGRVFCWGANTHGESGGATPDPVTTPIQVTLEGGATARATAVTTGSDFSCALMATGEVQCWGSNHFGQLGRVEAWISGTAPPSTLPLGWNTDNNATGERVRCGSCGNTPFLNRVKQISAGTAAVCALLVSGQIRCWGRNPRANGGTVRSAANEDTRLFGCGRDPRFCGCGWNPTHYCLPGVGNPPNDQIDLDVLPHAGRLNVNFVSHVAGGGYSPPGCADQSELDPFLSVSVHDDGACVITADSRVQCWGSAIHGRRGDGTDSGSIATLVSVQPRAEFPEDGDQSGLVNIIAVNGGDETSCALRGDGRVLCWGANTLRQTSWTDPVSAQTLAARVTTSGFGASFLKNAISVTAGRDQSCAMTEGWVRCWGARTGNQTWSSGPIATTITPL